MSSFLVVLAVAHGLHAWYTWSLPSFCRLPGMEPYRHTTHCRVHLASKAFVTSNVPLLDGPPPLPLHQVDFQELHELQRRMTAHMLNASVIDGAVMLKFIAKEINDKASDLYQLRMKVSERDREKERELRRTLYFGAELGGDLALLHSKVRARVEMLFVENQGASIGIEETFEEQPKSLLAQAISPLFPRYRDSLFWTWDTDTEVRFQFYKSLTTFSWILYSNLVDLVDHRRSLEVFGESLEALQVLLVEEPSDAATPLPASSLATWFFPWRTTAHPAHVVSPVTDAGKTYEALKKEVLDRLMKRSRVALDRVGQALIALRTLGQEVESVRHRIAEPGPLRPFYLHLKHISVAGDRMNEVVNKMDAFQKSQEKRNRRR